MTATPAPGDDTPAGAPAGVVAGLVTAPVFGRRRRPATPSTGWPDFAPPVGLAAGPLGVAQAADREIARQTALRARALARFAATRPASADRPQGVKGAMSPQRWAARPDLLREVSEWATPEVAIALSRSQTAAEGELHRSLLLVHRLPGTLAALTAGALHPGHLFPLLEHVAPVRDERVRAEIEAECLRWAAGRVVTPAQLADKARREVLRRDARDAAQELIRAVRQRGVHLTPSRTAGMAELSAVLTLPEAKALHAALGQLADTLTDHPDDPGGPRSRGQKMADALLDLVLRPGETQLPIVQVLLTVVAAIPTLAGGDQPAEIDGDTVPAEMVRALLAGLTGRGNHPTTPTAPIGTETAITPAAEPEPADTAEHTEAAHTEAAHTEAAHTEAAHTEAAHTEAAHTEAAHTEAEHSGPGGQVEPAAEHRPPASPTEPVEPAASGDPRARLIPASDLVGDPAWEELVAREETAWAAELERRILAGEFDDLPGPGPVGGDPPDPALDAAECRWQEEAERAILAGEFDRPPEGPLTDPPGPPGPAGPAAAGSPADAPAPDPAALPGGAAGGWWAAAERAVDEAGRAQLRLLQSLGHARALVHTARLADAADEQAWRAGPGGRLTAAHTALDALAGCTEDQRAELAGLLEATAGGGLADRPRIAVTAALTGALLALTDLPGLRRAASTGSGLAPPGPTDGYRPAAALDRFLRARDRHCRFPGCRRRVPKGGELDHNQPYPDGPTAAANLEGFCGPNHRGKHQAPGWTYHLAPDATLTITTPSGITTSTTPPPF